MQTINTSDTITEAIQKVAEMSTEGTDGRWLEDLTARVGPHIREWDITQCYRWPDWPERKQQFPNTTNQDVGIDCVAVRGSDGKHIAIQCKSRRLDASGRGAPIGKPEIDSFASASADDFWAERWLVINGATPIGGNAQQTISMAQKPVKVINIASDLQQQQTAFYSPPPPD